MVSLRAIKMGWNPRASLAHHELGSDWVKIFLQISIGLIFDPAHPG